jgi:hypothetical protein
VAGKIILVEDVTLKKMRSVYMFVKKFGDRKQLGRPRNRCEDIIVMDLVKHDVRI